MRGHVRAGHLSTYYVLGQEQLQLFPSLLPYLTPTPHGRTE